MKIISQEVGKIIPEFLSVTEHRLYHIVLSNGESLRLAPILPFSVCAYFYFSRFTFLSANIVQYDLAQETEKRPVLKKHYRMKGLSAAEKQCFSPAETNHKQTLLFVTYLIPITFHQREIYPGVPGR